MTKLKGPALFQAQLSNWYACDGARHWTQGLTARQAWEKCHRPDWMLWLMPRAGVENAVVFGIATHIVQLALQRVENTAAHEYLKRCVASAKKHGLADEHALNHLRNRLGASTVERRVIDAVTHLWHGHREGSAINLHDVAYFAVSAGLSEPVLAQYIRERLSFDQLREASGRSK